MKRRFPTPSLSAFLPAALTALCLILAPAASSDTTGTNTATPNATGATAAPAAPLKIDFTPDADKPQSAEEWAERFRKQAENEKQARLNRVKLDQPLYTNAPYSQFRLLAAARNGDGEAAWLYQGTNAQDSAFWNRLAATNGYVLAQVALAKEFEDALSGVYEVETTNGSIVSVSFPESATEQQVKEAISSEWPGAKRVKPIRRPASELAHDAALAKYWRERAKAALPTLKAAAATNDARALHALSRLHGDGDLVESNAVLAAQFLRRAAESGHAPAQAHRRQAHCIRISGNDLRARRS
jgi:TPR repeat protein